jgi:hypothetical protein
MKALDNKTNQRNGDKALELVGLMQSQGRAKVAPTSSGRASVPMKSEGPREGKSRMRRVRIWPYPTLGRKAECQSPMLANKPNSSGVSVPHRRRVGCPVRLTRAA